MIDDEMMVTEFELAEEVFVPAGDGEPSRWKRLGDLNPAEFARHAQERRAAAIRQMERAERYTVLVERAACAAEVRNLPLASVLSAEDIAELTALKMTLQAEQREQDRRQAAIDRDIETKGYWTLPLGPERPQ